MDALPPELSDLEDRISEACDDPDNDNDEAIVVQLSEEEATQFDTLVDS